ncbi:hypothetical protein ACWX0P_27225 [Vibrio mediterranei]
MPKLTKDEIQGIKLIAILFVSKDVAAHLETVDRNGALKAKELLIHLKKEIPKLSLAENELQKQIKDYRRDCVKNLKSYRDNRSKQ